MEFYLKKSSRSIWQFAGQCLYSGQIRWAFIFQISLAWGPNPGFLGITTKCIILHNYHDEKMDIGINCPSWFNLGPEKIWS